jgi:CheY-like chemotaxis protein
MAIKILLADDSLTIQKVVELTFSDAETRLMAVGSGDRAVQALDDFAPDIVLADVVMPGLTGYDVCDAVKRRPGGAFVPVVLLTGTFEPFDRARAERVGSDAIVTKPFDSHALQGLVRDLVGRARAAHAEAEAARAAAPPPVPETPPTMILSAEELEDTFPRPAAPSQDTGATLVLTPLELAESAPPPFAEAATAAPEGESIYSTRAMRIPTPEELAESARNEGLLPPSPLPPFFEPEPAAVLPAASAFEEPGPAAGIEPPPPPFDMEPVFVHPEPSNVPPQPPDTFEVEMGAAPEPPPPPFEMEPAFTTEPPPPPAFFEPEPAFVPPPPPPPPAFFEIEPEFTTAPEFTIEPPPPPPPSPFYEPEPVAAVPPLPAAFEPEMGPDTEPMARFVAGGVQPSEEPVAEPAAETAVENLPPVEMPFEVVSEPPAAPVSEEIEVELEAEPAELAAVATSREAEPAFALPAEEEATRVEAAGAEEEAVEPFPEMDEPVPSETEGEAPWDESPAVEVPAPREIVHSLSSAEGSEPVTRDIEADLEAFEASGRVRRRPEIWERHAALIGEEIPVDIDMPGEAPEEPADVRAQADESSELEEIAAAARLEDLSKLIPGAPTAAPHVPPLVPPLAAEAAVAPAGSPETPEPASITTPLGLPARALSDADVDRIARRVVQLLSDKAVRDIAWEVVPEYAERLVRERIAEVERAG